MYLGVLPFSPSSSLLLFFYIEHNVRFRYMGKVNGKNLKKIEFFFSESNFGNGLNALILHVLLLFCRCDSSHPCLLQISSSFIQLIVKIFIVLISAFSQFWAWDVIPILMSSWIFNKFEFPLTFQLINEINWIN